MKPVIAIAIALLAGSIPLMAQQASSGSGGQGAIGAITGGPGNGQSPQNSSTKPQDPRWVQQMAQQMAQNWMQYVAPACPTALSASHLADGSMVRTGSGSRTSPAHPRGLGQWLHITIMTPTVADATLTVRGYSDRGRMTETDSKNGPDAARAVSVTLADMANGQATGNVWVPGLTAVTSLDLISLTYSDGSSWSAPSGQPCRVTPDPLMLISGR